MRPDGNHRKRFEFRLDPGSGVPVYRQIIDQVLSGVATGSLATGAQLPTVRQLAVDLEINPNTVIRAYRELEIRGFLKSQQGTGTFINVQDSADTRGERQRRLWNLIREFVARAGAEGFTTDDLADALTSFEESTGNGG